MISTSIKLDGEAEFKKALTDINNSLKVSSSEMKYATEAFKGQANTLEALTEKDRILRDQLDKTNQKISEAEAFVKKAKDAQKKFADAVEAAKQKAEQQGISLDKLKGDTEKLSDSEKELAAELLNAESAYDKATKTINNASSTLNNVRADQVKLNRELRENSKYLDEARNSADKAAHSIDGFGKEVKESGKEVKESEDDMDSYGQTLMGVVGDLGKLKGAIVGGAAVGAIKELGGAILDLEENSREYRQIMGGLMATSEAAGINAKDAADRYKLLNGVMGDTQAAAEATAQLQTLQATEEQLDEATLSVIGSWTKLGGAAPIESIAQSISQTVAASQAAGDFSDILMATGQSEDDFNAKLAETTDASARLDLVLQALASAGMKDLGESYLANNEAAIQSNQMQDRLNEAYAELGEVVAPVADLLRNGWAGAVEFATEKVEIAVEAVMELKSWFDKTADSIRQMSQWSGKDLWNALTTVPGLESQTQAASVTGGLTGADLRERGLRAADIVSAQQAASRTATYAADAMANRGSITTVINIDGKEVARATQPYLREENKANPEVVSDRL